MLPCDKGVSRISAKVKRRTQHGAPPSAKFLLLTTASFAEVVLYSTEQQCTVPLDIPSTMADHVPATSDAGYGCALAQRSRPCITSTLIWYNGRRKGYLLTCASFFTTLSLSALMACPVACQLSASLFCFNNDNITIGSSVELSRNIRLSREILINCLLSFKCTKIMRHALPRIHTWRAEAGAYKFPFRFALLISLYRNKRFFLSGRSVRYYVFTWFRTLDRGHYSKMQWFLN